MKKIKLTEQQLRKVIDVVNEQKFDDAIVKYQREQTQGISMSVDDAQLLLTLGMNWCRGKENHPDCDDVLRIRTKLNLF